VTHFDHADVTQLEDFRKQHGRDVEAVRRQTHNDRHYHEALAAALKKFPPIQCER
jgi:pyruvate/2-oxoglutarate dehydrogenase complex dihydrolipoamide acyltransferase (E2) component